MLRKFIFNLKHQKNMFNLYKKEIEKMSTNKSDKGNILITHIGCNPSMSLFEGLYARKAIINGNKIYSLFCNQYLNKCEIISKYTKFKNLRCNFCKNFQQNFLNVFETIPCYYNEILDRGDILRIKNNIKQYFKTNIIEEEKIKFLNVNINNILYTALQRHYMMADPKIKENRVTKEFLFTIFSTLIVMDKLCKKIKPKYVMSTHGTYSTWGSVVEYCKVNNIRIITYGRTYNKESLVFAYNDSYLKNIQSIKSDIWKSDKLIKEEKILVEKFYDARIGKTSAPSSFDYNKGNKQILSKIDICKILKINKNQKIVAMLPNIPWDGQFNGNSPTYSLFSDWLKETIEFFKNRENSILIIRSHPAESLKGYNLGNETTKSMIKKLFDVLPNNIIVLPHNHVINSYSLGLNSDFIITYSSTISLELIYLRKPVLTVGNPPFKNKNIVFDINSKKQYFQMIKKGLKDGLIISEDQINNLYLFSFYFYFKIVMPETLIEIQNNIPLGFKFKNEKELNLNEELEHLFRCIESNTKLDFSEHHLKNDCLK